MIALGRRLALALRIHAKWWSDRLSLPLRAAHWEVYANLHRHSIKSLGRFPNLVNCADYNDKIQWLKLFDQRADTIRCTDKLAVRKYIGQSVGDRYNVPLYQVAEKFSGLNIDALPSRFVMKVNHDSGTAMLVPDKIAVDWEKEQCRVDRALDFAYGWDRGEWAYSFVEPKILVEEFLGDSGRPSDFKWHCVDGKVRWLQLIAERGAEDTETIVFPDGTIAPFSFSHVLKHHPHFARPREWDEMVSVAERLARGFKYVRVDMYLVAGRVHVGEMTFFPKSGMFKGEGQKILGGLLDFSRTTYQEPVVGRRGMTRSISKTHVSVDRFTDG